MERPLEIDAEYVNGQFRPLNEVNLPENAHVRLTVQTLASWQESLARVAKHRAAMFAENGYCFDSTEVVAAERRRDG